MYSYDWDIDSGGLLLRNKPLHLSKEPRPVYSKELDILGFDKYWNYENNDSAPYMWAEGNNYIYKGNLVAQTKGGAAFISPKVIIFEGFNNLTLEPVDLELMISKNHSILNALTQETIKRIYNDYLSFRDKVDLFYVAFSGGKDSILTLDLVQRALPHDEFKVIFGDTGMEFPDTYDTIENIKSFCAKEKIEFLTATSEFSPIETWKQFGPPAQRMRWCCSVHKTSPQILLLRRILSNPQFRGMAFTGIRAEESSSRADYEEISFGEKVKGQYSCHPILEWNSAELYLYTYENNLEFNEAYKKGNSRAGCLVCPLAGYKNMFIKEQCYSSNDNDYPTTTDFNSIIKSTTAKTFQSEAALMEFMNIAGWKARRSGRELSIADNIIEESEEGDILIITTKRLKTKWTEWLKTIGKFTVNNDNSVEILFNDQTYHITVNQENDSMTFKLFLHGNSKIDIQLKKAFKIVIRKSSYCIGCHVCEANCPFGFISMKEGIVKISDNCIKCRKCHDIDHGCLMANSLRLPLNNNKMGSINRYGNMGVEFDWVKQYLKSKDDFWAINKLGTNKVKYLKSFLSDCGISYKNKITKFGLLVAEYGADSPIAWGLMLSNLAYSSEFNWWIKNLKLQVIYTPEQIKDLIADESDTVKTHVVSALKNIVISNPVLRDELGFASCDFYVKNDKRYMNSIMRSTWKDPDPRVVLYSLYKFAEACGDYFQFTLSRLMDTTVDSEGVSPALIFGIDKETMISILKGLSINFPEFISTSFTYDLDNINLKEGKKSEDILSLF